MRGGGGGWGWVGGGDGGRRCAGGTSWARRAPCGSPGRCPSCTAWSTSPSGAGVPRARRVGGKQGADLNRRAFVTALPAGRPTRSVVPGSHRSSRRERGRGAPGDRPAATPAWETAHTHASSYGASGALGPREGTSGEGLTDLFVGAAAPPFHPPPPIPDPSAPHLTPAYARKAPSEPLPCGSFGVPCQTTTAHRRPPLCCQPPRPHPAPQPPVPYQHRPSHRAAQAVHIALMIAGRRTCAAAAWFRRPRGSVELQSARGACAAWARRR